MNDAIRFTFLYKYCLNLLISFFLFNFKLSFNENLILVETIYRYGRIFGDKAENPINIKPESESEEIVEDMFTATRSCRVTRNS